MFSAADSGFPALSQTAADRKNNVAVIRILLIRSMLEFYTKKCAKESVFRCLCHDTILTNTWTTGMESSMEIRPGFYLLMLLCTQVLLGQASESALAVRGPAGPIPDA